jgi:Ca2+-binding EF-hand superfamily protein
MDFEINQISDNEKWRDMIKEFDHDGDGRISFHEFIHAIEGFITKLYECDDKCAI